MSCTHGDASCWICLEGGDDFPLRRGCGCRGDAAGWAHIHCLSSFARAQTSSLTLDEFGELLKSGEGTNWQTCNICKQNFVGEVARDLADQWVKAVTQLDDGEAEKLMAQLNYVREIILSQSAADQERALRLCEEIRACAKRSWRRYVDSPSFVVHFENTCLVILSTAHGSLGNSEKAKQYSRELRELNKATQIADADANDDFLSLMFDPSKRDSEELRNIFLDMYNQSVETLGRDSPAAIRGAACVGDSYFEARQSKEAIKWLDDAYSRAKRVFGKDHPDTLLVRRKRLMVGGTFDAPRVAKLATKDRAATRKVTLLRATKDGTKYIATIESTDGKPPTKVKVSSNQIILEEDTPIVHPEDGFTCFVDSYNKRTNTYKAFAFSGVDKNSEHAYLDVPRSVKVFFIPKSFDMRSLQAKFGAI